METYKQLYTKNLKIIHSFNEIPTKTPAVFYLGRMVVLAKWILKFIWKQKELE